VTALAAAAAAGKRGRKKKDPNEPQKPVSAYALFFRDTQAAIKGQNPNASFGEVSKIVASMWDSLAEEQKQVSPPTPLEREEPQGDWLAGCLVDGWMDWSLLLVD
jgi:hypothetical protein